MYWNQYEDEERREQGECRRYAPKPCLTESSLSAALITNWPATFSREWCGEYEETDL
jgi:hypothetical protein